MIQNFISYTLDRQNTGGDKSLTSDRIYKYCSELAVYEAKLRQALPVTSHPACLPHNP